MGRKSVTEEEKARKALFKEFLREYPIKDGQDLNALVREFVSDIIDDGLDAELDEKLGYSKYDYKNKQTNRRTTIATAAMKRRCIPAMGTQASEYPQAVWTLIYTTNAIEGYNRQLRKVAKTKALFPAILLFSRCSTWPRWTLHKNRLVSSRTGAQSITSSRCSSPKDFLTNTLFDI